MDRQKSRAVLIIVLVLECVLCLWTGLHFGRSQTIGMDQETLMIRKTDGSMEPGFYTDYSCSDHAAVTTEGFPLGRGIYEISVQAQGKGGADLITRLVSDEDTSTDGNAHLVSSDSVQLKTDGTATAYRAYVHVSSQVRVEALLKDTAEDGSYLLLDTVSVRYLRGRTLAHELSKLLFLFLAADILLVLFFFFRTQTVDWLRTHGLVLTGLAAITAFACWPMLRDRVFFGNDILYHLRRLNYLGEGLMNGQFPVKIQTGWSGDYGYAVGVGYGDLLMLPAALFVILGYPLSWCYELCLVYLTALTAWIAYRSFTGITKSRMLGLTGAALYTLYGFRLYSIYSEATFGEFTAATFLPLVLLGLWEIYTAEDAATGRKGVHHLAGGIALVLSSHVVTTFLLALTIPLGCLLFLRQTLRREVLVRLFQALGLSILLGLYFLVPVADYLLTQGIAGTYWEVLLWDTTNAPEALFANLPDPNLIHSGWAGIGWWAFGALALCLALLLSGRFGTRSRAVAKLLLLEVVLLWASSESFPWFLVRRYLNPVYEILTNMQFAWRMAGIAGALLVLLTVLSLSVCNPLQVSGRKLAAEWIALALGVLCVVQTGAFYHETLTVARSISMVDRAALPAFRIDEFSIDAADPGLPYREQDVVLPEGSGASGTVLRQHGLTVTAQVVVPGPDAAEVRFPRWGYKGYQARTSQGQKLPLYRAADARVAVTVPAGYEGEVTVSFHEPWYWRVAELISLFTLVWLLLPTACKNVIIRQLRKE